MANSQLNVQTDKKPDLDNIKHDLTWKEVRETLVMLYVAIAQMEMSMRDGDQSVNTLVESFTHMSADIRTIDHIAQEMHQVKNRSEDLNDLTDIIQSNSKIVGQRMQEAVIAFQFYDKLSQRLTHVSSDLGGLSRLVSDPESTQNQDAWEKLKDDIRNSHSMVEEEKMFQAIMDGVSIKEAIQLIRDDMKNKLEHGVDPDDDDDIELF